MVIGFDNITKEKVGVVACGDIITLTKTINVAAGNTGQANFSTYTLPDGYTDYVVLEASQTYQNKKWVGGQYSGGRQVVYPWCTIEQTGSVLTPKMGVYNPITQGALDITATIKLLLIP